MLYINREAASIDSIEGKGASEKYSKEMIYKLPAGAYYWCHENRKIITKNSQSLLCAVPYAMRNKDGAVSQSVELRYAENAVPNQANPIIIDFSPLYITIPTSGIIKTNDMQMEKNFFLMNHVNNGSNLNRPKGYEILFERLDKEGNARRFLEAAADEATAKSMVLGNYQLTDEELKKVAYVYYHTDAALYQFYEPVESMEPNSIRQHLYSLASFNPKMFMKFFATTQGNMRELINKSVGKKLLSFDEHERTWLTVNESGIKELVLQLKKTDEPAAALINMLENNDKKGIAAALGQRLKALEMVAK